MHELETQKEIVSELTKTQADFGGPALVKPSQSLISRRHDELWKSPSGLNMSSSSLSHKNLLAPLFVSKQSVSLGPCVSLTTFLPSPSWPPPPLLLLSDHHSCSLSQLHLPLPLLSVDLSLLPPIKLWCCSTFRLFLAMTSFSLPLLFMFFCLCFGLFHFGCRPLWFHFFQGMRWFIHCIYNRCIDSKFKNQYIKYKFCQFKCIDLWREINTMNCSDISLNWN